MMSCLIYLAIVSISMLIAMGLWFRAINRQPLRPPVVETSRTGR
jgi:drug/metabolite transporter (DMT)-like permease